MSHVLVQSWKDQLDEDCTYNAIPERRELNTTGIFVAATHLCSAMNCPKVWYVFSHFDDVTQVQRFGPAQDPSRRDLVKDCIFISNAADRKHWEVLSVTSPVHLFKIHGYAGDAMVLGVAPSGSGHGFSNQAYPNAAGVISDLGGFGCSLMCTFCQWFGS